jgi:hypothetical protein
MQSSIVLVHMERDDLGRTIAAFKSLIATTYARALDPFRSSVHVINLVPVLFVLYSKQGKRSSFANEESN